MRIFFAILGLTLIFGACSPYQKALKSEDVGEKYHFADSLYQIGKYRKALRLMEQVVPAYRGRPQAERLMFLYADTYYNLGDYYLSSYQFERFTSAYPESQKAEEAAYKGAKSYYHLSPRYSKDQKETHIALDKLQGYINAYPDSELLPEANTLVAELIDKLEKKRFEVAKQYHHRREYKAAIKAFDNYILDFPGSDYRKEAYYLRLESAYLLAINSFHHLIPERLEVARGYYNSFNRYYGDSDRKADADEILKDIEKRLAERPQA